MFVAEWVHTNWTSTYTETFGGKTDSMIKCQVTLNAWISDPMRGGKHGQAPQVVALNRGFPHSWEVAIAEVEEPL